MRALRKRRILGLSSSLALVGLLLPFALFASPGTYLFHLLQLRTSAAPPSCGSAVEVNLEPSHRISKEDAGTRSITARLTQAFCESVEVFYEVDGTAEAGVDYTGLSRGSLVFNPGETAKTLSFTVLDKASLDRQKYINIYLGDTTSTEVKAGPISFHREWINDKIFSVPNIAQAAPGAYHTCALATTGKVYCWGANWDGQLGLGDLEDRLTPRIVDRLENYSQLVANDYSTCGITTDGVLKCWGGNWNGLLGDGTTTSRLLPTVIDSGVSYSQVSAGGGHTCGITTAGVLKCWGRNTNGRLGDGTTVQRLLPTIIDSGVSYSQVSAGGGHTCGITSAGVLKCWGGNDEGQLGDGTWSRRELPTIIDSGVSYSHVSTSGNHTCGMTTSGTPKCWGSNWYGELGDGTYTTSLLPKPVVTPSPLVKIQAMGTSDWDYNWTCGITQDQRLFCWGSNWWHEHGSLREGEILIPTEVNSNLRVAEVRGGTAHSCFLTDSQEMLCSGWSLDGQLGSADKMIETPGRTDGSHLYSEITRFCGITTTGILRCWAYNGDGQVGDGSQITRLSPVTVDRGVSYSRVSQRGWHSCAIATAGVLKCWGFNGNGRLGDGTTTSRLLPTIIDSGVSYSHVSVGDWHSCGITTTGVLKCWGNNNSGQLGDGTTTHRLLPTVIDSGVGYSHVYAGRFHTCGITTTGVLKCWGNNNNGHLGDGTTTQRALPTVIDSGVGYSHVSLGDFHSCGITTAGALKCWGANSSVQLGDGTTTQRLLPTVIDSGVSYSRISAGEYHNCGITTAGVLKCWGNNSFGRLGDGTTTQRALPTVVDFGTSYSRVHSFWHGGCGITTSGALKCWGPSGFHIGRQPHFLSSQDWSSAAGIIAQPSMLEFLVTHPSTSSAWQTLTLTNHSLSLPLRAELILEAGSSGNFELASDTCSNQVLAPQASCTVDVRATGISRNDPLPGSLKIFEGYAFLTAITLKVRSSGFPNPCASPNVSIGEQCDGGAIYAGGPSTTKFMITRPGTCEQGTCNDVDRTWRGSSGTSVDIPGVANVTSATVASTQSGESTTPLITSHSSISSDSAAHFCRGLHHGGYSDWFLPAKSELAYLFCKANVNHLAENPQERPDCVGFGGKTSELQGFMGTHYWSSTEGGAAVACAQNFSDGAQNCTFTKTNSLRLRCMRSIRPLEVRHFIQGVVVAGPITTSDWFLVHVSNTTSNPTGILSTSVSGPFEIAVATNSCAGSSLAPGATCTLEVRANTLWDGPFSGTVSVSAGALATNSPLSGTATGMGDPCANLSSPPRPPVGARCFSGAIYAGEFNGQQYLVTPGGCNDSTTPTCNGTDALTKQWSTANGGHGGTSNTDGATNTLTQSSQTAVVASKFCGNMDFAGTTGWFLPARDELVHLYNNKAEIGEFAGELYWSSTQATNNNANAVSLATGATSSTGKNTSLRVRCVRKE
jgi:alpha-tubulin suppressor-like RCC1 family protein